MPIPLHTFSGRDVYPLQPTVADIVIEDIAHALSHLCRYGGHVREFYSVAQHSVIVSHLCDPEDALAGLLHDASEAYLVDLPMPVKVLPAFESYRAAEANLQACIYQRFNLPPLMPASVRAIDEAIRINEAQDLFAAVPPWAAGGARLPLRGQPIVPWRPDDAEARFMARFRVLTERAR